MKLLLAILIFTFSVFPTAEARQDDCFDKDFVTNFYSDDPEKLEIWEGGDIYDLDVWYCSELPWANRIGFRTFPSWSLEVCKGDYVLVLDDFTDQVIQRCKIRKITKRD